MNDDHAMEIRDPETNSRLLIMTDLADGMLHLELLPGQFVGSIGVSISPANVIAIRDFLNDHFPGAN